MSKEFTQSKNVADFIRGNIEAQRIPDGTPEGAPVRPLSETAIWYNREDKSFYEGPLDTPVFFSENEVMHLPDLIAGANSYAKDGDVSGVFDKASFYKNRYEALADSYYRKYIPQVENYKKMGFTPDAVKAMILSSLIGSASATAGGGGGAVHPDTLGAIEKVNVLSGIMAIGEVGYKAQDAVPRTTVQFIKGTFFKRKQMKAQRNIRLGKPILTTQVEVQDQTYEINGIGTHVATHWEIRLLPYYVDLYQESLNVVAQAITEAKAIEVRDTIEGHGTTPVTMASWSAKTSGSSTRDPVLDIDAAMTTIMKNGGNASRMTIGPTGNAGFETNRWRNEGFSASNITEMGQNKQYNWRGLTVTVDSLFAGDKAIVYSDNAFKGYQGPVQTFDYENPHTRTKGQYYLEYFGAELTNNLEVVELGDID